MSMPRKAMQALGFQACCLRCDAADSPGLQRCTPCIEHHRSVRETIAAAPPDDPLFQLARELMTLAAAPHRHDHDEVHGPALIEQQRLAAALLGPSAQRTPEDVFSVFEAQRQTEKANVLRDIGNQNDWKNDPLPAREARTMGETTWLDPKEGAEHYGARTVPSKPINRVDRSERLGEDTALTDRVHAAVQPAMEDDESAKIFEELDFKERQRQRSKLQSAMKDIKDLVDDDLEF